MAIHGVRLIGAVHRDMFLAAHVALTFVEHPLVAEHQSSLGPAERAHLGFKNTEFFVEIEILRFDDERPLAVLADLGLRFTHGSYPAPS